MPSTVRGSSWIRNLVCSCEPCPGMLTWRSAPKRSDAACAPALTICQNGSVPPTRNSMRGGFFDPEKHGCAVGVHHGNETNNGEWNPKAWSDLRHLDLLRCLNEAAPLLKLSCVSELLTLQPSSHFRLLAWQHGSWPLCRVSCGNDDECGKVQVEECMEGQCRSASHSHGLPRHTSAIRLLRLSTIALYQQRQPITVK